METFKSPRIWRFIEECADPRNKDGVQAAIAAGYSPNGAHVIASRHLSDSRILTLVQQRIAERAQEAHLDISMVLKRWLDVATADPSKIVRVRRLCCRHCHGINHAYQWTAWEYAEKAARAFDYGEKLPSFEGGDGFKFNADPHPDCPHCMGEGTEDVFLADTSTLTGPERALYAGAKVTRNGIEVQLHDQTAAWDNIRDYLGMIVKRGELTGKNGQPLFPGGKLPMVEEVLPDDPKQLEAMYLQYTKGT